MQNYRPDLNSLEPEIRNYIEALEQEIERLQRIALPKVTKTHAEPIEESEPLLDYHEPPTTINIITMTGLGIAKRTPRHLYARQRRGGMGVFDLETTENDPPKILAVSDQAQTLLALTDQARVFRLPVDALPETPLRGRGISLLAKIRLAPDEQISAVLPEQAQGYLAILSQHGFVRLLRHHIFGEHMKPGTSLYDPHANGPLAGACWTPGDGDVFIATSQGKAIRFSEKLIPPGGAQAIRLENQDHAVAITAVDQRSQVFLLGSDGKGTIRTMDNFYANKAPGAGGKLAMNTDQLISARSIKDDEDIFIISKLSKIIRFNATDVPAKEGVVQGVVCMSLRADTPAGIVSSTKRVSSVLTGYVTGYVSGTKSVTSEMTGYAATSVL